MLELNGLVKLAEECAELGQVTCKKMARMNTDEHWDGAGPLSERLEDEMGDVLAAIEIVSKNFGLDWERIVTRQHRKFELFQQWMDEAPEPTPAANTSEAQDD